MVRLGRCVVAHPDDLEFGATAAVARPGPARARPRCTPWDQPGRPVSLRPETPRNAPGPEAEADRSPAGSSGSGRRVPRAGRTGCSSTARAERGDCAAGSASTCPKSHHQQLPRHLGWPKLLNEPPHLATGKATVDRSGMPATAGMLRVRSVGRPSNPRRGHQVWAAGSPDASTRSTPPRRSTRGWPRSRPTGLDRRPRLGRSSIRRSSSRAARGRGSAYRRRTSLPGFFFGWATHSAARRRNPPNGDRPSRPSLFLEGMP